MTTTTLTRRLARRAPLPALASGALLIAASGAPATPPSESQPRAAQQDPRNTGLRVRDELVFRRPDGSRVAFKPDVAVWCGPWEPGEVETPAIHVYVGRPGRPGHWELSAVVADVQRRPVVRVPSSFDSDRPAGALLFTAQGNQELSSQEEEGRGTITFRRVRCDGRIALDFRVRATLGSEFIDGERWKVRGRFRARSA